MQIQQGTWTIAAGWDKPMVCEWGDEVQLVLVFGSPSVIQESAWRSDLQQQYPNARLLGCSTAGEIAGTTGPWWPQQFGLNNPR
jgi:FIST N domain